MLYIVRTYYTQSCRLRISGGHAVNKEFDSIIKGYVISLSGSPATTRIQLPKAERKNRTYKLLYSY